MRRRVTREYAVRESEMANRILAVAEDILGTVGVDRLRLAEIASRLNVTVPAIYAHFRGGRSELIAAIELRALHALTKLFELQSDRSPREQLVQGIRDLVRLIVDHPAHLRVFFLDWSYPGGLPAVTRRIGPPGQAESIGFLRPMYDRLAVLLSAITGRERKSLSSGLFFNSLFGAICVNVLYPPFAGVSPAAKVFDLEEEMLNLAMCWLKNPTAASAKNVSPCPLPNRDAPGVARGPRAKRRAGKVR